MIKYIEIACDMAIVWGKGAPFGWYGPRMVILSTAGYMYVPLGSRSTCLFLCDDYMQGTLDGTSNTLVWGLDTAQAVWFLKKLQALPPGLVECAWLESEGRTNLINYCTYADASLCLKD